MNQFRCLHLIQVGSTVPGSCHHLTTPHQPISCNHYTLVALQGCRGDPDSGYFTRAFAIHLPFFSVWRVLVVITWSLWGHKQRHTVAQPMYTHHIPRHSSRKQYKATHTDIWWWLGCRKLHHVAPDVWCLIPRSCWNASTHQQTQHIHIYILIVIKITKMLNIKREFTSF